LRASDGGGSVEGEGVGGWFVGAGGLDVYAVGLVESVGRIGVIEWEFGFGDGELRRCYRHGPLRYPSQPAACLSATSSAATPAATRDWCLQHHRSHHRIDGQSADDFPAGREPMG